MSVIGKIQVIQAQLPRKREAGMREFQLCLGCAVAGALLIGLLGTVLGLPFFIAATAGFVACFAAARKGVMDVLGGAK